MVRTVRSGRAAASPEEATAGVFAVLVVCTGNLCRSPLAEDLLRARLRAAAPGEFEVLSMGTRATAGRELHPLTRRAMQQLGLGSPEHASQQLSAEAVRAADLILTMERSHRTVVAGLDSSAARRTFTLREFGRLTADLPAGPIPASRAGLVAALAAGRGRSPSGPQDDVDDPVAADLDAHLRMATEVSAAVQGVASALLASAGRG